MSFHGPASAATVFVIAAVSLSYGNFIDDYCWRDYNGEAPSDAFKAGIARDGTPIYIGQTLFDNKLIPGKIHENKNEIHIEFYKAHLLNETIKILCTDHPEKFEWLKISYKDIISTKNKHFFEGGYEKGVTTYIGRALSHSEMTVGKVICWTTYCIQLSTVENGTYYQHNNFEILVYNSGDSEETNTEKVEASSTASYENTKYKESVIKTKTQSPWAYVLLSIVTLLVVAIVILLVRRC